MGHLLSRRHRQLITKMTCQHVITACNIIGLLDRKITQWIKHVNSLAEELDLYEVVVHTFAGKKNRRLSVNKRN